MAPPAETRIGPEGEAVGRPRIWPHALGLLVLLLALIPVVGTRSAFVTDESFVIIQLDTIEDSGSWLVPHPIPEVDPEGAAFPLHGASRFEDGYTLYGKHPALIYLYLPIHRAFGIVGLVAVSALGTWVAALVAAALANRIRTGSGPIALWLVGLGSPLFFDAYVVHAHTVGAALAGLAALAAVRLLDRRQVRMSLGVVAALLGVALLRTEGIFFAAALGGSIGLFGLLRRRLDLVLTGVAAVGAGAGAYLIDRAWAGVVAGSDPIEVDSFEQVGLSFLTSRATSASYTFLMPGYRGGGLPELLTVIGAVLLVVGTLLVRRRPQEEGAVLLPCAGAALLAVRAVLEWGPVPGFVLAFCVGMACLSLIGGSVARSPAARLLLLASGTFAVLVAGTQYAYGGHTEWGGRYFALALPLLGAVGAASLHRGLPRLPRGSARAVQGSLIVASVALALLAVVTLRSAHDRNRSRSDGVLAAAAELPTVDGRPPVVLTEDDQIPRLARGRFGEVRFLNVPPPFVERYLVRLARAGVEDVLVVSLDPEETLTQVPPVYDVVGPIRPHGRQYDPGGGLIRLRIADD